MESTEYYISPALKDIYNKYFFNYGLVRNEIISHSEKPNPKWVLASYGLSRNPVGLFFQRETITSAGSSINLEKALNSAIGESIERYNCLNSHLIDPLKKEVFINEEIKFARCAEFESSSPMYKINSIDREIDVSEVCRLSDGSKHWIPAEHVHLGYKIEDLNLLHTAQISTGCAFYINKHTAIYKGLCEVLERDAFMRVWLLKSTVKKVDFRFCRNNQIMERLKRIRNSKTPLSVHIFEISDEIAIPTFITIIKSSVFPFFSVGSSANGNFLEACLKSIDEAISLRTFATGVLQKPEYVNTVNFDWVSTLEDHLKLYANWENSPAFDFLFENAVSIDYNDLKVLEWLPQPASFDELKALALSISIDNNLEIYWKDITLPEIQPYGSVVRVIIPEAVPLSQSFNCRWLMSVGDRLNHDFSLVNNYPHPFA